MLRSNLSPPFFSTHRGVTAAETHPSRSWPRIIKPPNRQKGIIRFGLCPPDQDDPAERGDDDVSANDGSNPEENVLVVEAKRSKRLGRHVWRDARKRQWGDLLPPGEVIHALGEAAEAARGDAVEEDDEEGDHDL